MKTRDLYQEPHECCGCGACADVCARNAITMKDDVYGFRYPVIEDESLCVDCNLCQKVCPIKHASEETSQFIEYYAASLNDRIELISCASGGFATSISRSVIKAGGIVYGASYTDDWKSVKYIRCTTMDEINRLKTSKYSQASTDGIYASIRKDLKEGVLVLFIGLPCNVAAIKRQYSKFENLYTIELVCHGPTSPKVHREYCNYLESKHKNRITYLSTRHKKNGKWKPFYLYAEFEKGAKFSRIFHFSPYGVAFRYLKRPSCYKCIFKDGLLKGDIMIGDYHYAEEGMKGYNPHGTSSVLVHNAKGKKLLDMLGDEIQLVQIQPRCALANRAIHHAIPALPNASNFAEEFRKNGIIKASNSSFVHRNQIERWCKEKFMHYGIKIKRLIMPSARPHNL